MKQGKLIVISGPSAVGKTTVAEELKNRLSDVQGIVTYTTRKKRPGEHDKVDYNFISEQEFKDKINNNFFLEWAQVYNNYYGTSLQSVQDALESEKNVVLVNDIQGQATVKQNMPSAIAVFILPESIQQLKQRWLQRPKADPQDIQTRLDIAQQEIDKSTKIADFRVINVENKLNQTVNKILNFIQASGT